MKRTQQSLDARLKEIQVLLRGPDNVNKTALMVEYGELSIELWRLKRR